MQDHWGSAGSRQGWGVIDVGCSVCRARDNDDLAWICMDCWLHDGWGQGRIDGRCLGFPVGIHASVADHSCWANGGSLLHIKGVVTGSGRPGHSGVSVQGLLRRGCLSHGCMGECRRGRGHGRRGKEYLHFFVGSIRLQDQCRGQLKRLSLSTTHKTTFPHSQGGEGEQRTRSWPGVNDGIGKNALRDTVMQLQTIFDSTPKLVICSQPRLVCIQHLHHLNTTLYKDSDKSPHSLMRV